ncbi:hypothetical protein, partial [Bacteroides stercoris]|uniref:hypothetical protein n=1 Tax=Bacteroides stercoris TaxID=46506 RepID=UPI001C702EF4
SIRIQRTFQLVSTLIAKGAHWEDDERYSNTLRLPSDFIFVVANLELLNPSFSGVTTRISSPTSSKPMWENCSLL